MIASATLRDLKTILEVRILDLLGTSDEPLRREDIIESLKTNGKRCGTALKNLVEKGLVTKSEKFRVTVYEASVKLQIVPAGVRIVPHEVQNESAPSPTLHTRLDPPHTDPEEQEVDFSMFPDTTRRLLIELWDARDRTIDKEDIRQDVIGDDDVGDGAVHMVVTRARSDMKKYGFPYEIQYVRERKRYTLIPKGSP